jgi:hypothetical protein
VPIIAALILDQTRREEKRREEKMREEKRREEMDDTSNTTSM